MVATATAMVPTDGNGAAGKLETALLDGDLSRLTPQERLDYYRRLCESLQLNPLTRPFAYITFKQGGLQLYARKDATEQLRKVHGISLGEPKIAHANGVVRVVIGASDRNGRTDFDMGAVGAVNLSGEPLANAEMKAITKAKRRVTLSICGLGMLDESEVDSVPGATLVEEEGIPRTLPPAPANPLPQDEDTAVLREELDGWLAQYPDMKQRLDEYMESRGATALSDEAVRKAVTALRQRAADEEAQRQDAAQAAAVTDMSGAEALSGALEVARKAVAVLSAKKGGPNAGDYQALRTLLSEIQRCDPLPDDTPPESIQPKLLLDALRSRLAVADAGGGAQGAAAVKQEIDDSIPF